MPIKFKTPFTARIRIRPSHLLSLNRRKTSDRASLAGTLDIILGYYLNAHSDMNRWRYSFRSGIDFEK
ncbi:MAG: hypothetical protein WCX97_00220 [Candidatus Magasanikbacteria bacterium]